LSTEDASKTLKIDANPILVGIVLFIVGAVFQERVGLFPSAKTACQCQQVINRIPDTGKPIGSPQK